MGIGIPKAYPGPWRVGSGFRNFIPIGYEFGSGSKFHCKCKSGLHIGIVGLGLGGLGRVAVKFAKAFRSKLLQNLRKNLKNQTIINHSFVLILKQNDKMQVATSTLHATIDTVFAVHPLLRFLNLLKNHAKYIMLGAPEKPLELPVFPIFMGKKSMAGSNIEGLKETEEILNFAAKHGITTDVEVIQKDYVNTAIEHLVKNDVRYRFGIDVGNTLNCCLDSCCI
ncbi:hypothetical protein M9H77_19577 [Catharanthus roseus]|uniref:Uncharacterized protein n=1 Tax=Catharanthus roseus TaxID=4058 RepID=A0ACC0BAM7_CATRO|nr:hypothetical protein M9H77_19577 [Catharanthus roseus]